jgi:excisionase family DNA binding protein
LSIIHINPQTAVLERMECNEALRSVDLLAILESKAVWTIPELSILLDISDKTLYKQAASKKIPAFNIGACVRVYGKAFAEYLRKKMR